MLKTICQVLDIERSGKQSVLIERIMAFLMHPVNTGKVQAFDKTFQQFSLKLFLKSTYTEYFNAK